MPRRPACRRRVACAMSAAQSQTPPSSTAPWMPSAQSTTTSCQHFKGCSARCRLGPGSPGKGAYGSVGTPRCGMLCTRHWLDRGSLCVRMPHDRQGQTVQAYITVRRARCCALVTKKSNRAYVMAAVLADPSFSLQAEPSHPDVQTSCFAHILQQRTAPSPTRCLSYTSCKSSFFPCGVSDAAPFTWPSSGSPGRCGRGGSQAPAQAVRSGEERCVYTILPLPEVVPTCWPPALVAEACDSHQ